MHYKGIPNGPRLTGASGWSSLTVASMSRWMKPTCIFLGSMVTSIVVTFGSRTGAMHPPNEITVLRFLQPNLISIVTAGNTQLSSAGRVCRDQWSWVKLFLIGSIRVPNKELTQDGVLWCSSGSQTRFVVKLKGLNYKKNLRRVYWSCENWTN